MFLKRLFCKHKHVNYLGWVLIDGDNGQYVTQHVWKCTNCQKEITTKRRRK